MTLPCASKGKKMKVSIIICTYNEEKTIANVVISCCKFNPESEIIVIDDGSIDKTEKIIKELAQNYSFIYEKLPVNKGKSWAMVRGVEISTGDIILFFDADVSNIKQSHFDELLNPIYLNSAEMVLGQASETIIHYRINPFKWLTGERALLKKDILPILNNIRDLRFGVETYINLYFLSKGKRIKNIKLDGVYHPSKWSKTTPVKATKEFIFEGQEIAVTLVKNHNLVKQHINHSIKKQVSKFENFYLQQ